MEIIEYDGTRYIEEMGIMWHFSDEKETEELKEISRFELMDFD